MMTKTKKSLRALFAVLILALLIYKVGPQDLYQQFRDLSLEAIFYLMLISVLLIYVSAWKWQMFLRSFSEKISVIRLFGFYLVGYFVNLLVPSHVGGDAVRSWYVGKEVGQHEALASTILERYTGVVAMITLAFISMWFVSLVTWPIKLTIMAMALGLVVGTIFILSDSFFALLKKFRVPEKIISHCKRIREGLDLARKNKPLLFKALILSFLYHSLTVLNTIAAAYAVGWTTPPIVEIFVVLPIILLIGSLPFTPGGLGLQEGAFVYFLKGIGATSSQALALGILLRAKTYVLALIGGIVWLRVRTRGPLLNNSSLISE